MATEATRERQRPNFVTQLNNNDVLLGRGAPSIENQGNVRFRQLVQARKPEYVNTGKRQMKDWIARQVIQAVRQRNGNFLRKIESLVEAEQIGVPEGITAWAFVEESTILQKVKQALRDKDTGEVSTTNASLPAPWAASETALLSEVGGARAQSANFLQPTDSTALLNAVGPTAYNLSTTQANLQVASSISAAGRSVSDFLRTQAFANNAPILDNSIRGSAINVSPLFNGLSPTVTGFSGLSAALPPGLTTNLSAGSTRIQNNPSVSALGGLTVNSSYAAAKNQAENEALDALNKESRAEVVLQEAWKATGNAVVKEGDSSSISLIEWLILQTVVSLGIPVWHSSGLDDTFSLAGDHQSKSLPWSTTGVMLARIAQDYRQQQTEADGVSLALHYAKQAPELARTTICLLERLYQTCRSMSKDKDTGPAVSVYAWFTQQLCQWSASLDISCSSGRPLSHISSDFRAACPEYAGHQAFAPVAVISPQGAEVILRQVAHVTRLRSILTRNPVDALLHVIQETQGSIDDSRWISKPSWWATLDNQTKLQRDVCFLERTILSGYRGILEDLYDKVPPGLTKAAVEERVSLYTAQLHLKQVKGEEQQALENRNEKHLALLQGASPMTTTGIEGSAENSVRQNLSLVDDRGFATQPSKRFRGDII